MVTKSILSDVSRIGIVYQTDQRNHCGCICTEVRKGREQNSQLQRTQTRSRSNHIPIPLSVYPQPTNTSCPLNHKQLSWIPSVDAIPPSCGIDRTHRYLQPRIPRAPSRQPRKRREPPRYQHYFQNQYREPVIQHWILEHSKYTPGYDYEGAGCDEEREDGERVVVGCLVGDCGCEGEDYEGERGLEEYEDAVVDGEEGDVIVFWDAETDVDAGEVEAVEMPVEAWGYHCGREVRDNKVGEEGFMDSRCTKLRNRESHLKMLPAIVTLSPRRI